jgi:hypothetical protein
MAALMYFLPIIIEVWTSLISVVTMIHSLGRVSQNTVKNLHNFSRECKYLRVQTPLLYVKDMRTLDLWVCIAQSSRAIAQAVSRWFPTAAARVRARVWSSGICATQSGTRGRFSPSTWVSPANLHYTKFSILTTTQGRYNSPEVAEVPSWPSLHSTPTLCEFNMFIHCAAVGEGNYF